MFGEASFILGKNRTVTAVAGEDGLTARLIKSDHLIAKLKQDIFLSALVRKLEARLSNSNEKSEVLANGMKDISTEITAFIDSINERNADGRVIINKLNELEKEFEFIKSNLGLVGYCLNKNSRLNWALLSYLKSVSYTHLTLPTKA